jgi:hypothetical protein
MKFKYEHIEIEHNSERFIIVKLNSRHFIDNSLMRTIATDFANPNVIFIDFAKGTKKPLNEIDKETQKYIDTYISINKKVLEWIPNY